MDSPPASVANITTALIPEKFHLLMALFHRLLTHDRRNSVAPEPLFETTHQIP